MLLISCQGVTTINLELREAIHGMVGKSDLSHIQVFVGVFCLVGEGKGDVLCQYFV